MRKLLNEYFIVSLVLLILIISIRFFELFYISPSYHFPFNSWRFELVGILYDTLFYIKISVWLFVPYALLYWFKPNLARTFFTVAATLIVVTLMTLTFYFGITKVPLGADLFGYSLNEIVSTSQYSGTISLGPISILALFTIISLFLLIRVQVISVKDSVLYGIYGTFFIFFIFGSYGKAQLEHEFDSYLASNKAGFFIESVSNKYKKNTITESYSAQNLNADTLKSDYDFEYFSENYPFLHRSDLTDALGPFFNQGSEPPSIVIIIVESLGRAYSGENADLGSFTPFLDSLAKHSLYWENMLSTSGRTFSVVPSLLASLPFGEHGFCELGEKMPPFHGLIGMLKPYNYRSSFYYGGDSNFDNMAIFLKKQDIDRIIDKSLLEGSYEDPPSINGYNWGYSDKVIFKKYLSDINQQPDSPHLDIILTLSIHDPFLIKEQKEYYQKFDNHLQTLNLSTDKNKYLKLYKAQLATVLYSDDAIRDLIKGYSKRSDFNNTIFIITGDHRMPEIPITTQLDRYHVPLIIWSPMIKTPQSIKSISTHFDVLPSLMSFLHNNYEMDVPSTVAWIGQGLDMEPAFRNIHSYPLMRNKGELIDFISGEYLLSESSLYQIYSKLEIEQITNQDKQNQLAYQFEMFKMKNKMVVSGQKLLPDSFTDN